MTAPNPNPARRGVRPLTARERALCAYAARLRLHGPRPYTQREAAGLVYCTREAWARYETAEKPADEARIHLFALLTGQEYRPPR